MVRCVAGVIWCSAAGLILQMVFLDCPRRRLSLDVLSNTSGRQLSMELTVGVGGAQNTSSSLSHSRNMARDTFS